MKKYIIILLYLLVPIGAIAQSTSENLQKYWYYRERLRQNFVVVSANNEPGSNIPADYISLSKNEIGWDDGNMSLSHYIAVLATEYRLLKDYGQTNYQTTINELYYALKALDRLDLSAETYFGGTGSSNGFFVRWDVNQAFWSKYQKGGTAEFFPVSGIKEGTLVDNESDRDNIEPSQDNIYHMLEGLSLVATLVDNETVNGTTVNFKTWAKNITSRIVGITYHSSPVLLADDIFPYFTVLNASLNDMLNCLSILSLGTIPTSDLDNQANLYWYLKNPVTGDYVEQGSGVDLTGYTLGYGYRMAAKQITGNDNFTNTTNLNYTLFKGSLGRYTGSIPLYFEYWAKAKLCLSGTIYPTYGIALKFGNYDVASISSDPTCLLSADIASISDTKTIANFLLDDYKFRTLSATGNISPFGDETPYECLIRMRNQNTTYPYEHLPLLWGALHRNDVYPTTSEITYVESLLNSAPQQGPYNYSLTNNAGDWSSSSRLVWPENLRKKPDVSAVYSGLDYMLLHNLHWLVNLKENTPSTDITISSAVGVLHGVLYLKQALNSITLSSSITSSGDAVLVACKSIKIEPGTHISTMSTGSFIAKITESLGSDYGGTIYETVSLDDYPYSTKIGTVVKNAFTNDGQDSSLIENKINVYPNPFSDKLFIQGASNVDVTIFDLSGKIMLQTKNVNGSIDLSTLQSGMYLIQVKSEGKIYKRKIFKQ
jgi:hypothetical protein